MRLNPPIIAIKVTKGDCTSFVRYCNQLHIDAFQNANDYQRTEPTREALLKYHVFAIGEQCLDKLYKYSHESDNKLIKLKFNHAERLVLSVMFRRVEVPIHLQKLEFEIINHLTLKEK